LIQKEDERERERFRVDLPFVWSRFGRAVAKRPEMGHSEGELIGSKRTEVGDGGGIFSSPPGKVKRKSDSSEIENSDCSHH